MAKEISKEFSLRPEEAVVLRNDKVAASSAPFALHNNELILTNQAIIFINKDLFGKTKEVVCYPLSDICLSGGKPQAVAGGDKFSGLLDIYFTYERGSFVLEWRDDVDEWIASITETVTGEKVQRKTGFEGFEDMLGFAESVTGTVNGMRKVFGIKSTEKVACKCPSCGASVEGTEDEVVTCPYCGSSIKLTL